MVGPLAAEHHQVPKKLFDAVVDSFQRAPISRKSQNGLRKWMITKANR